MMSENLAEPTTEEASPPGQSQRPTPKHKLEGHKNHIWSFVFLHDNVHIVSGSWDGTICKWNCDTGLLVGKPWEGNGGRIRALALSPNGETIACGRDDGSVQRWNTDGIMIEGAWTGEHSNLVLSLSWSPSGGYIASGFGDGIILIRNTESGEIDSEAGRIETKLGGVYTLAYSPSGDKIASGGDNEMISIWDSKTGASLIEIREMGDVTSLVWSSDSSKLYSTFNKKFIRVFNSTTGAILHDFEHKNYLFSVALSPKHNALVCVGSGIAQLWDPESYQPLGQPFDEEDHAILLYVSFSRDGKYLAYSGDDKKITLWMVEDIAPQLKVRAPATQPPISSHLVSTSLFLHLRTITGRCHGA
jgi:WD40 repeat protein